MGHLSPLSLTPVVLAPAGSLYLYDPRIPLCFISSSSGLFCYYSYYGCCMPLECSTLQRAFTARAFCTHAFHFGLLVLHTFWSFLLPPLPPYTPTSRLPHSVLPFSSCVLGHAMCHGSLLLRLLPAPFTPCLFPLPSCLLPTSHSHSIPSLNIFYLDYLDCICLCSMCVCNIAVHCLCLPSCCVVMNFGLAFTTGHILFLSLLLVLHNSSWISNSIPSLPFLSVCNMVNDMAHLLLSSVLILHSLNSSPLLLLYLLCPSFSSV